MRFKFTKVFFVALAASTTFARLQGHHRRHSHGNHISRDELNDHVNKRGLIDVNGAVGVGPLTATLGLDVGPTNIPGPPGSHDSPGEHQVKPTAGWDHVPADGKFSRDGFGKRTKTHGDGVGYVGNVGDPWGSNIITVKDAATASKYKYVAQIHGPKGKNAKPWTVVFWNKIGPDNKMSGWYGHSALKFKIAANEVVYVAVDENSQGGFAAAPGDKIPTDQVGGYSATWGEWDFGDTKNKGLSGWDVSSIQAQNAKQTVQGMRMCLSNMDKCSTITRGAKLVQNAYDSSKQGVDGLGSTVGAGPVRLVVELDFVG